MSPRIALARLVSAYSSGIALVLMLLSPLPISAHANGSAAAAAEAAQYSTAPHLPLTPFQVVTGYDPPPKRWLPGHRGIDVAATVGQEIYAPAASVVHFAGTVAGREIITLRLHNDDLVSFEPVSPALATGEEVAAGALIATVADRGQDHCVRGPCLHIGLRRDGHYLHPLALWPSLRPPIVLLPPL